MMVEKNDLSNLSSDVIIIAKIASFNPGDPRYIKLDHSPALRIIYGMFRIFSYDPVIEKDEDNDVYKFKLRFSVVRIALNNPLSFNRDEDVIKKQAGKIQELFDKEAIWFEELTKSKAVCHESDLTTIIAFLMLKDHNDKILHDTRQISSSGKTYASLGRRLEDISQDFKTRIERQISPQRIFGLLSFQFQMEIQFDEEEIIPYMKYMISYILLRRTTYTTVLFSIYGGLPISSLCYTFLVEKHLQCHNQIQISHEECF